MADTKLKIMSSDKIKYLGIIIDQNIKWKDRITLSTKLRRFIHNLYELPKIVYQMILITLYKSVIDFILSFLKLYLKIILRKPRLYQLHSYIMKKYKIIDLFIIMLVVYSV